MDHKGSNNLCNTYILPLVGCSKTSFGVNNLINSFVAEDNVHVVVQVNQITSAMQGQTCYKFHFQRVNDWYAVYEVPYQLRDTIILFRGGKYSKFSELAKTAIRNAGKRDGLKYKVPAPLPDKPSRVITSKELMALDKEPMLRLDLEQRLGVKIEHDAELASIPGEECFFTLNLNKQVELVS